MSREFNGSTDRIDWSAISDLTGDPLTISAWVNTDAWTGNPDYILEIHTSGDAGLGMQFYINEVLSVICLGYQRGSGATSVFRVVESGALASSWHHVLVTHSGTLNDYTTIHIYLDGTELTTNALTQNGSSVSAPTGSWSIGGRIYDDVRNFDGSIADLAVWDAVKDGTTITALAAGYSPSNYSTNLLFYYSAHTNTTTAEIGGAAATVDGTANDTSNPAIIWVRAFAGGITPSGNLTSEVEGGDTLMTLTGGITPAGTLVKSIGRALAGAITPHGPTAYLISSAKTLAGAITPSGTLAYLKAIAVSFAGGITPSGTIAKVFNAARTYVGGITPTGTIAKVLNAVRSFAGGITPSGTVAYLKAIVVSFAGGITPTGTMTWALNLVRTFTGAVTMAGTIIKSIPRTFAGAVASAGTYLLALVSTAVTPASRTEVIAAESRTTSITAEDRTETIP